MSAPRLRTKSTLRALHVAATTRAVAGLLSDRGVTTGDLLVPAPQEQRTARGDVGNGLSLLFYRVPRAVVPDLAALVAHATQQVRGMIREAMPAAMTTLEEACAGYTSRTGKQATILTGSSPGAAAFGVRTLD